MLGHKRAHLIVCLMSYLGGYRMYESQGRLGSLNLS
jgi:hypothetical protein